MSYNFHIGQDIVAVRNHVGGDFKKDDIFVVKSLRESTCKCEDTEIDIGIMYDGGYNVYCPICQNRTPEYGGSRWYSVSNFAPLDSLTNIDELTEILSQPLFEVK